MQGYREEMEDAHAHVMSLHPQRHAQTAFLGVFDGHGMLSDLHINCSWLLQ
jgi:serine/threonine protein phosphatase PrpC